MARAFSVTVGTPTQCDGLTVSWTGGQAPFEILLTPSMETFQNISVPASAFSNGEGSYTISPLTLAVGTQFLLTMSDATGFGSGGTTNELTVGNPIANNNCDTQVSSPPYTFDVSPLQPLQCGEFTLTYAGAILPVTIVQLIPGGKSVVFNSVNSETYMSVADVSAGTNLMFFMTDSEGRPGGISGFIPVLSSSDASCLHANSPPSTPAMADTTSSSASGLSSNEIALIAGAAGGGVTVLALVILVICCCRRRKCCCRGRKASHSRSRDNKSSKPRSRRLQRGDPGYESNSYSDIAPQFPPPHKKKPISSPPKAIQRSPKTQSNMANSSAGDFAVGAPPTSFSPTQHHERQSSNTDFPVYGDARNSTTMTSPYDRIAAMTRPTSPTYPLPYPVIYLSPLQPGSQSPPPNAYTGNFAASEHPTLFNQTWHSRQSLNADFAVLGDAQSSAMSSVDRRMSAVPETTSPLPWQTDPVSYPGSSIQSGSQSPVNASAGDLPAPPASKPRSKAIKSVASKSQVQDPSSPEAASPAKKSRPKAHKSVASESEVQDPSSPEAAPPAKKSRPKAPKSVANESEVQDPSSPEAAPPTKKPRPKARPAVTSETQVQDPSSPAAAPSVSEPPPVYTAPSEDSVSLPRKKKKVTQPESSLTGTGAGEVETPVLKPPRKAQSKASDKTAKSASAPKKEKEI